MPCSQVDAWGANAVRVRQAPPGGAITTPPVDSLRPPTAPADAPAPALVGGDRAGTTIVAGNLRVDVAAGTGFVTATRVSDGVVLLAQTAATFGRAAPGSRAGSVSAEVTFAGHGADERVYGLGSHQDGRVGAIPGGRGLFNLFERNQWRVVAGVG